MSKERQNRTDDRVLKRWLDEIAEEEGSLVGVPSKGTSSGEPGKQTLVERGDPRIAELRRRAAAGELPPGKWTLVEATIAATPKQSFADCQAMALRDVVLRLGANRELELATLAAADPNAARRVIEVKAGDRPSPPASYATSHGQAMWGAAKRRAVTLYRRARAVGIGAPETTEVTEALDEIGTGAPLPDGVRQRMEAMVGETLENVRLHTGPVAAAACQAVNAEAFTVGQDIYYPGFDPGSLESLKTLAHECVHVQQWQEGRIAPTMGGAKVSATHDPLEQEAEATVMREFSEPTLSGGVKHPWQVKRTVGDVVSLFAGGKASAGPSQDNAVLLRKPMRYEAPRAAGEKSKSDESASSLELSRGENVRVRSDGSVVVRTEWILSSNPEVRRNRKGEELGLIAPACMAEVLRQLKSAGIVPWIETRQIAALSQEIGFTGLPKDSRFFAMHLGLDVFVAIGPPPDRDVWLTKQGDNVAGVMNPSLVVPDGVSKETDIAVSDEVRQTILARLEAFTGLPLPVDAGARAMSKAHEKEWNFRVYPGRQGVVFTLSKALLEHLFTKQVWASHLEQPPPRQTKGSDKTGAALSFAGDVSAGERAYVEQWLKRLRGEASARPVSHVALLVTSELVAKLHDIDAHPQAEAIVARLRAGGQKPNARPLDVQRLDNAINAVTTEHAHTTLGLAQPPQKAEPIYDEPVRVKIVNRGSAAYVGQTTQFYVETQNHRDAFAIPDVNVRWVVTERNGTKPLAQKVTHSIDISTKVPEYFEYEWPQPGLYTIHAFVSHAFYQPTYKTDHIEVKTEAERNRELTQKGFRGLAGPTYFETDGYPFDVSWFNTAFGSDKQEYGKTSFGNVPEGYQRPTLEQRTAFLANEQTKLNDMRASHSGSNDPRWKDANQYAEHQLNTLRASRDAIDADQGGGAIFFDARGAYLSRQNGLPDSTLTLVAFAKRDETNVTVKLHDLSQVCSDGHATFEGTEATFTQALERAFSQLTKAYPPGRVSALFEVLNDAGTPTGATRGYEFDTGTAWKSVKSVVYNPHVHLAINLVGAATMVFCPPSAMVVFSLATYNSIDAGDSKRVLYERGQLTKIEVAKGVGQVGLNFIPFLGALRPIQNMGRGGVFMLDGVSIAGQMVILSADGVKQLHLLRDQQIGPIADLDVKIRDTERTNPSDPDLPKMRADLEAKIKHAQDESTRVVVDMAKAGSVMLVQTAGTHALNKHVATKRLAGLVKKGVVQLQSDVIPHYDAMTATVVGDEALLDPQTLAKLQQMYQTDLADKRAQIGDVLGSNQVEIVRTDGPVRVERQGDGYRVELPTRQPFEAALAEAQRVAQAQPQPRTASVRTPADRWVDDLRSQLDGDAGNKFEQFAKGKSSQEVMDGYNGDFDIALQSLENRSTARSADTADRFTVGPLPKSGPARWKYLQDPAHWTPERAALHNELIANAKAQARAFADQFVGKEPTLYAMRGNTAAGKTRAVSGNVQELAGPMHATKDLPHRSVNPDNFKADLIKATPGATSSDVHAESSILARRLETELLGMKTADGQPASMLIDKRLLDVNDVLGYAEMAKGSGRKFVLFDVDAPLEHSLAGVLERVPGGADPLPPFKVVADGFDAVRTNRNEVMDLFNDPSNGSYHLYATTARGDRVEVATIDGGHRTIKDGKLYWQATEAPENSLRTARITRESTLELTRNLPSERAANVRGILVKYEGWTWKAALDAHSREQVR